MHPILPIQMDKYYVFLLLCFYKWKFTAFTYRIIIKFCSRVIIRCFSSYVTLIEWRQGLNMCVIVYHRDEVTLKYQLVGWIFRGSASKRALLSRNQRIVALESAELIGKQCSSNDNKYPRHSVTGDLRETKLTRVTVKSGTHLIGFGVPR